MLALPQSLLFGFFFRLEITLLHLLPLFQIVAGGAVVIGFAGGAFAPSVFCDDFELARMTNGRFLVAKFAAGKHLFRSNDNQEGMDLDLKGGQDYYIRMDVGPSTMKGLLVLVAPDEAGDEIKKLKPLDAANIKDSDHVMDASLDTK